jgi:predicted signal transduction protein with EAL and GGDEF domain/HAMP domain-containing protein
MAKSPRSPQRPLLPKLLLRSRFGRRLLLLFVACTLIPTCAVALLSFYSVARQLTGQSQKRLVALAASAGKTIGDRVAFLEADIRRQVPGPVACLKNGAGAGLDCGDALLYAVDGLASIGEGGVMRRLAGAANAIEPMAPGDLPALEPGQSAVFVRADSSQGVRLYLLHRPEDVGARLLLARISTAYVWGPTDLGTLPGKVDLALWDPGTGSILASGPEARAVPEGVVREMARAPTGVFESRGADGPAVAAYWSLPQIPGFRSLPWRVILTEPRSEVLIPMADFSRTFPILLGLALVVVVILGTSQIRKSLVPLEELRQGTQRIAGRDFTNLVRVTSGDELEELAGAFNAMTGQLGRQFHALNTAAEIDRAVLSSVDTTAIVKTVLDRLPEICPCDCLSVTLIDSAGGTSATNWIDRRNGAAGRSTARVGVSVGELQQARQHPERLEIGKGAALPGYLAHFGEAPAGTVIEFCPLRFGGELLGVLALQRGAAPSAEDILLQVRRIADQVAVALSNARMVDQVRFLAFYDSLTRLPNRVLYKERLGQALVRAQRNRKLVAVCFLDLDHFSRINDTLGHDLGDRLVQEVANRLLVCCRAGDSVARLGPDDPAVEVARLGGDEFTVVLPDISGPQEAVRVAQRLLDTFKLPFVLGSQEVFVTASIGIAIYPFDGTETEDLLKHADVAMYHAKSEGRNTCQLYSSTMNSEALTRLQLEHQLRRAVEAGEFTLWYQPIVDLKTRRPTGGEALVRWAHPERGLVSPGEFISLCEECGLIVPLGEWILRSVCAQAQSWEAAGLGPIRVSVNLSARQLRQEGIVQTVRQILEETDLGPAALVLELTESMLMQPSGVAGRTIRELADLGVSIAIDDFGTGYSSLSYLKNFPVSTLKIDRSFIQDVTTSANDAGITTAILAMAKAMDLDVVAEGVETEEQAAFLKKRGCPKIQGYLVGRPMPAVEFGGYLRAERSILPER